MDVQFRGLFFFVFNRSGGPDKKNPGFNSQDRFCLSGVISSLSALPQIQGNCCDATFQQPWSLLATSAPD